MQKCTFKTQFTRTPDSIRKVNTVKFTEPSKVKTSLAYATDINTIYENYCRTGRAPLNGNQPIYDSNFINYDSLLQAQNTVREAVQYFNNLPSDIRNQYGNKLENFVNAVHSKDDFLVNNGVLKLSTPSLEQSTVEPVTSVQPSVQTPVVEPVNTATTDVI